VIAVIGKAKKCAKSASVRNHVMVRIPWDGIAKDAFSGSFDSAPIIL